MQLRRVRAGSTLAALVLGSSALAACQPATGPDPVEIVETRSPNAAILGDVAEDGECDHSVIDIDHEKPTAKITYFGQAGDRVDLKIITNFSGNEGFEEEQIDLGRRGAAPQGRLEYQVPTSIPNESIDRIEVAAVAGVGKTGQCFIPVA